MILVCNQQKNRLMSGELLFNDRRAVGFASSQLGLRNACIGGRGGGADRSVLVCLGASVGVKRLGYGCVGYMRGGTNRQVEEGGQWECVCVCVAGGRLRGVRSNF